MRFAKIVFYSTFLTLFLASCTGSDSASIEDSTPAPPDGSEPTEETADPISTATTPPTAEPTAEPTTEPEEPPASSTAEPQPAESEPAGINIQPGVEAITITGAEDLSLQTTLYTPEGSSPLPGVILLHMLGSDRQVWEEIGLTDNLLEQGYVVLAVDMRGHGETDSSIDWQLAPQDSQQVWDYFTTLDTVDAQRTAVIGASIGANLALLTGAAQPDIRTVILLSPGLDYRGVTTETPMEQYGQRPILIVASEEDSYSADSSRTLADLAQGESQLELYNGAGHGTRMFNAQPDLTPLIISWLNQNLN